MATKKKRRRKRRYKTGVYISPKCKTPIKYRSGWELTVAKYLDKDSSVKEFEYESFAIEYVSNLKTKKVRLYYPDFLITYMDGSRKLVEVKRQDKLGDPIVVKKQKAAEEWCANQTNPITYQFWSNQIVEAYKKILEPQAIAKQPRKRSRRSI